MLHSFSVRHYRNLTMDKVGFGKVNVLIGPNNSGKSNFIDAISFMSNMITNKNNTSNAQDTAFLNELDKRGWGDLLDRRTEKPGRIGMTWTMSTDIIPTPQTYDLEFEVPNETQVPPNGFKITREVLRYEQPKRGHNIPYRFINCHDPIPGQGEFSVKKTTPGSKKQYWPISDQETVLNQLENLLERNNIQVDLYLNFMKSAKSVRNFFTKFRSYPCTNLDLVLIRLPVKNKPARYLNTDGSNFLNVLAYLDSNYNFLPEYTYYLQEILHGLDQIKLERIDGEYIVLHLFIRGKVFKLSEMSDGTIKAMILALLLFTPEKYSLLSLDEPEINIHPAWLKVIAGWISNPKSAEQVFISTHSPDLLDGLTEKYRNGNVRLYAFNLKVTDSLEHIQPNSLESQFEEGWELGDLYRIGEPKLGGWPW